MNRVLAVKVWTIYVVLIVVFAAIDLWSAWSIRFDWWGFREPYRVSRMQLKAACLRELGRDD